MNTHDLLSRAGRLWCALLLLLTLLVAGCKRSDGAANSSAPEPRTAGDVAAAAPVGAAGTVTTFDVKGEALGDGIVVGAPKHYDNLTVFPLLAKTQTDMGPIVSLSTALDRGEAEVRELGGEPSPGGQVVQQQQTHGNEEGQMGNGNARLGNDEGQMGNGNAQAQIGGGAQVGKLAIQNKGQVAVYVLAGTIVKGGKQDRQIGQDFIIGAEETVPIDAFCVEHGRWNGTRDGKATGGKFEAVAQLAHRDVRVAGQYKKDQSEVWSKVSKVNEANKKTSSSDSLLATADDAEVKRERDALSRRILRDLDGVSPAASVVGYAYAVDGKVKAVRWFAHHRVFGMFREVLVNTAVADAMTARAASDGTAPTTERATAKTVAAFVDEAKKAPVAAAEVRETAADNVNEYQETSKAYRSKTMMKTKGAKPAPKVPVSVDFAAK